MFKLNLTIHYVAVTFGAVSRSAGSAAKDRFVDETRADDENVRNEQTDTGRRHGGSEKGRINDTTQANAKNG